MASPVLQLPEVNLNRRFTGFRCVVCGREMDREYAAYVCPDCGIDGILDAVYDLEGIRKDLDAGPVGNPFPAVAAGPMWRFHPLLPVCPVAGHPAWRIGGTPLQAAPRLAATLGVAGILLKDDTVLPSASLKDRAAAVAVAHARYTGSGELACASTGNAAASLAVLAARHGVPFLVAAPVSTVDLTIPGGDGIPIEERGREELVSFWAQKLGMPTEEVAVSVSVSSRRAFHR